MAKHNEYDAYDRSIRSRVDEYDRYIRSRRIVWIDWLLIFIFFSMWCNVKYHIAVSNEIANENMETLCRFFLASFLIMIVKKAIHFYMSFDEYDKCDRSIRSSLDEYDRYIGSRRIVWIDWLLIFFFLSMWCNVKYHIAVSNEIANKNMETLCRFFLASFLIMIVKKAIHFYIRLKDEQVAAMLFHLDRPCWNIGNENTGSMNIGNLNTGNKNIGSHNTSHLNTGDWNTGDSNIGSWNSGCYNTGAYNAGDFNSGNRNAGDWNTGDYNTGDWNTCSHSSGCFCTEQQPVLFFNKPSTWSRTDWRNSEACRLMDQVFDRTDLEVLMRAEKIELPCEAADGYISVLNKADCSQLWWDILSEHEKMVIKNIPNFDAEVFKQCTGIDINMDVSEVISKAISSLRDLHQDPAHTKIEKDGSFIDGTIGGVVERNIGKRNYGSFNIGSYNIGDSNIGNSNIGHNNVGSSNRGIDNVGDGNTCSRNTGNKNVGSRYIGRNTGNRNVGDYNTGDWNRCNRSTGYFCTEGSKQQPIMFFNRPSEWTYEEWRSSEARKIINQIPYYTVKWKDIEDMTHTEKVNYPTCKISRGYIKVTDESECRQIWWDELPEQDKQVVKSLPNFDAEIFKQCTDIDVNKD